MSLFEKGITPQNDMTPQKVNGEHSKLSEVFLPDERLPVSNTQVYPFQSICRIDTLYSNNESYFGTGAIIGPQTILTAAHNIYRKDFGLGTNFTIVPGLNGSSKPYGSFHTSVCEYPKKWIETFDQKYDFGAIFLSQPLPNTLHPIEFASLDDDILNSKPTITICGYPKDKPEIGHPLAGRMQYYHSSKISEVTPFTFKYYTDTKPGQSGSPLLYKNGNNYFICAIHNTGGNPEPNSATRITDEIFKIISKWRSNP